ncbi:MAG TPA: flagellar biosynthetic protein FliO [Bryobacteraceae bacterium]|nr:flagellar biosynthetic protein FliO [Bryobacteraceae bacterium]
MEIFQQLFAVFFVLAVLCACLWLFRRNGWALRTPSRRKRSGLPHQLEVLEGLTLTPHHSLHLVRLADRVLLVGLSPQGCSLLDTAKSTASTAEAEG